MTRWDALLSICGHLRAGMLGGERVPERAVPWELMIEVASFHYVTPALAGCLAHADLPADVRDYFASVVALNGQRNAHMLTGLARTAGLLNVIGIEPLLLKGANLLADGTYPEPSQRLLGDVDVLIPQDRAAEAVAALSAAGFATRPSDVVPPPGHHHLPMLHDPETGVGVELHTDVISRSPDAAIATAWFSEKVRPALFRGKRVLLPEPTRNAGHVIFHSHLFHALYALNKIQLRHLLDLALIRARHESAIDWGELDRRFSDAHFGDALPTYLDFADALFAQPAPPLSHAPRPNAMADLRAAESRDSFHSQIERLKDYQDTLVTHLSHMTVARDRFQSEAEQLRASLAELTAQRNDIAAGLDRATAAHAETAGKLAATAGELVATKRAREELDRELAGAERVRQELERELAGAERVRQELERELADAERARQELEREQAAAKRARAELEGERARILASRSWRWTAPLRAVIAWRRRR